MTIAEPFLDQAEWADIERLPHEFDEFATQDLPQRAAGTAGKTAFLQLHFERRNGKTHLIRNFSGGHQVVRRVHYMDQAFDDLAVVMIMQNSSGILQGDRIRTEIKVGPGARALITTQSAAKIYKMEHNYASQRIDIDVADGAYAEVMLDPMIPYVGSRLYNEVNLTVAPTATLIYGDQIASGRRAHGESWAYELLYSRINARSTDNTLLAADTQIIYPARCQANRVGMFGANNDLAMMFAFTPNGTDVVSLANAMHDPIQDVEGVIGGASRLPGDVGAHARLVGESTTVCDAVMHGVWAAARHELVAAAVPPIYRSKHGFEPRIPYIDGKGVE